MNTNIIRLPIITEQKYHSASQKWSDYINKYKICWASQKEGLQDRFWDSRWPKPTIKQPASNPYDSPDVTLVYEDELQFWRTK